MKTIIIYNSKSGFTENYSKIIAKELNCKKIHIKNIKQENLSQYDTIIFGSRIIAGKIEKLKTIKTIVKKYNIKKLFYSQPDQRQTKRKKYKKKCGHLT